MKIKASNNFSQNLNLIEKKFISSQLQEVILSKTISGFRQELIDEITQSSLKEEKKQEIIGSIEIEKLSPLKFVLKINNQDIENIEYGTQENDEDPIILRAKIRIEKKIHQIIQAELNTIKN